MNTNKNAPTTSKQNRAKALQDGLYQVGCFLASEFWGFILFLIVLTALFLGGAA